MSEKQKKRRQDFEDFQRGQGKGKQLGYHSIIRLSRVTAFQSTVMSALIGFSLRDRMHFAACLCFLS